MKTLVDKVGRDSIEVKEGIRVEAKSPEYPGLNLVKSVDYAGPTSIKYWM